MPYGAVFLSTSCRDFWSRWSRPATQLVRRMVYHPLLRCVPKWLAVPLLFAINGTAHYDVGAALNGSGDRAEASWNAVFGVLGAAALAEVVATDFLARRHPKAITGTAFKVLQWALTHVSLLVAVYILAKRCLHFELSSL